MQRKCLCFPSSTQEDFLSDYLFTYRFAAAFAGRASAGTGVQKHENIIIFFARRKYTELKSFLLYSHGSLLLSVQHISSHFKRRVEEVSSALGVRLLQSQTLHRHFAPIFIPHALPETPSVLHARRILHQTATRSTQRSKHNKRQTEETLTKPRSTKKTI